MPSYPQNVLDPHIACGWHPRPRPFPCPHPWPPAFAHLHPRTACGLHLTPSAGHVLTSSVGRSLALSTGRSLTGLHCLQVACSTPRTLAPSTSDKSLLDHPSQFCHDCPIWAV